MMDITVTTTVGQSTGAPADYTPTNAAELAGVLANSNAILSGKVIELAGGVDYGQFFMNGRTFSPALTIRGVANAMADRGSARFSNPGGAGDPSFYLTNVTGLNLDGLYITSFVRPPQNYDNAGIELVNCTDIDFNRCRIEGAPFYGIGDFHLRGSSSLIYWVAQNTNCGIRNSLIRGGYICSMYGSSAGRCYLTGCAIINMSADTLRANHHVNYDRNLIYMIWPPGGNAAHPDLFQWGAGGGGTNVKAHGNFIMQGGDRPDIDTPGDTTQHLPYGASPVDVFNSQGMFSDQFGLTNIDLKDNIVYAQAVQGISFNGGAGTDVQYNTILMPETTVDPSANTPEVNVTGSGGTVSNNISTNNITGGHTATNNGSYSSNATEFPGLVGNKRALPIDMIYGPSGSFRGGSQGERNGVLSQTTWAGMKSALPSLAFFVQDFWASWPAKGSTGNAATTPIQLKFDKPVAPGTGMIEVRNYADDSVVEAFDVVADQGGGPGQVEFRDYNVVLHPTTGWGTALQVYVYISAGAVEATDGDVFAGLTDKDKTEFTTV